MNTNVTQLRNAMFTQQDVAKCVGEPDWAQYAVIDPATEDLSCVVLVYVTGSGSNLKIHRIRKLTRFERWLARMSFGHRFLSWLSLRRLRR